MLIGYARVSTEDQELKLQIAALERAGCERIYADKRSGKNLDRIEWRKCYRDLRSGDTLVVWKLDRLGRSVLDLVKLAEYFHDEGIELLSTTENFDTKTPMGRFMFHFLAGLAQWERDVISERTKAGMDVKREEGWVPGRPPRVTPEVWHKAIELVAEDPRLSPAKLAERIGEWMRAEGKLKAKEKPIGYGTFRDNMDAIRLGAPYPERWAAINAYHAKKKK